MGTIISITSVCILLYTLGYMHGFYNGKRDWR